MVRAGRGLRALQRDEGGNLLMIAGITLMLAFVVTSVTLSQVSTLESRALQDRDRAFLNEYRFVHEKLATSIGATVQDDTDLATFRIEFAAIEETIRVLEAAKGFDVFVEVGNTSELEAGYRNELSFVNQTTWFYEGWSYDGDNPITDIPYDGSNDGLVKQADVIVGVVVNLRLSDGERTFFESILLPTNAVELDLDSGYIASAPQSLFALSDGTTTYVSWSAPATNPEAVVNYSVYSERNGVETYHGAVEDTYIGITGLTVGGEYSFRVRAVSEYLAGSAGSLAFTLTPTAPLAPQNLALTRGNGTLTLDWDAPQFAAEVPPSSYKIYRGTASGATTHVATNAANDLDYEGSTGLVEGTTYYFNVTSANAYGEASTVTVSGKFARVPDAPASLTLTPGDGVVTVSWPAPASNHGESVTTYRLYRGLTSGSMSVVTGATSSPYSDTNVVNGVTYYYKVLAVNAIGDGPATATSSATPSAGASIPSSPQNFAAAIGNRTLNLTWQAPADLGGGLSGYYVSYKTTVGGTWTTVGVGPAVTAHQFTGLANGTPYDLRVSAYNGAGTSSNTSLTGKTPLGAPTTPEDANAVGIVGAITVTWSAPDSNGGSVVTHYLIQRSTDGVSWTTIDSDHLASPYSDTSAALGTSYRYRVAAVNAIGQSGWSNPSNADDRVA